MVNANECVATARQVDPFIWSQYAILHLKLEIAQQKYKSEDTARAKQTTFAHLFVQVQFSAQVLLLLLYCLLQFSSSELNNYCHSVTFTVRDKLPYL